MTDKELINELTRTLDSLWADFKVAISYSPFAKQYIESYRTNFELIEELEECGTDGYVGLGLGKKGGHAV